MQDSTTTIYIVDFKHRERVTTITVLNSGINSYIKEKFIYERRKFYTEHKKDLLPSLREKWLIDRREK